MTVSTKFIQWLDQWVTNYMSVYNVPGLALAITDRNGLLHQSCFGYADQAAKTPVTPDTLFEIGSISKSATAIAVLQLCEEGKLDLHAPVESYLPWFKVPSPYPPITLHHLLSHTAGIINGPDFSDEPYSEVLYLNKTEVSTPPGSYFHYSNVGYKALGLVLEMVLGMPYYKTIHHRVIEPLGIVNSTTTITHETRRRMATGYDCLYDDRPFHRNYPLAPATWLEYANADGSITANAADLATYLRALMNRGKNLLSEESFQSMIQPIIQQEDDKPELHYGYGLDIELKEGRFIIGHSGGMVGYVADVRTDLEIGLGAVVLANGPAEPADITFAILKALRAEANNEPLPALTAEPDSEPVENAVGYAGLYRSDNREFSIEEEDGRLVMTYNGQLISLEKRQNAFFALHPDFNRFLLRFDRQEDNSYLVYYGPEWFVPEGWSSGEMPVIPDHWTAYPGHYHSFNPWLSNFRIVLRRGSLFFVEPNGEEEPLTPLPDYTFRVGEPRSPERISFSNILNGHARQANLSGCDYFRWFTD